MPFVRTVLGDIPADTLGVCYAHEHIIIDPSKATEDEPDFLLDDVERAAEELKHFHEAGGRAMVDTMPGRAGRNALKLAAVSRSSRVHIVCPTGLHLAKYYNAVDPILSIGERQLADYFVREIAQGVDEANGHVGESIRAGVIKVASGRDRLSELERRAFSAAAIAHRETGCPIITHTEAGTAGHEQIDIFERGGVDLTRVVLSHTDRLPDLGYHRSLLCRGVKLEYDSAFRWKDTNHTLGLVRELFPEFPHSLMLGMDAARRSYWTSYGGSPGICFLLKQFRQQLSAVGIRETAMDALLVANPSAAYSFRTA